MIGRLFVQLVLHLLKIPDLRIGILFQIEDLILLVAPHHIDSCLQRRSLFLLHEKRPVRTAEQPCRTGDHFKAVTGRLLASVVDGQNADAVLVGKLLEPTDDLIIAGVAVRLAADFPDFLHGVNDNEFGVGMFSHEVLKLLAVMSGDHRYEKILAPAESKKEVTTMYSVAQRLEEQGLKKGIERGRAQERIELLVSLCKAGHISIDIAAAEMHVSKEKFQKYLDGEIESVKKFL